MPNYHFPWNDLDLDSMTLVWPWPNLWPWPQTSQNELNWCPGSQISISTVWPWPWPNEIDTQTWPRYCQDVPPHQKWSFYVNWFKSYSPNRQTHSQTDTHTTKTLPLPLTREVTIWIWCQNCNTILHKFTLYNGAFTYFNRSANYVRVLVFGQLLGLGIKSRLVITRALFIIEKSFMYWAVLGTVMDLHLLSY